jgi:hypothetical protein
VTIYSDLHLPVPLWIPGKGIATEAIARQVKAFI